MNDVGVYLIFFWVAICATAHDIHDIYRYMCATAYDIYDIYIDIIYIDTYVLPHI